MIQIKDIETQVKSYYCAKIKRDGLLMIILNIAFITGQFITPILNGWQSMVIGGSILIFILINFLKNKNEQDDWIWASAYKPNFSPYSPYAECLPHYLRPNLEKIFQDQPKLNKSRFGRYIKKHKEST